MNAEPQIETPTLPKLPTQVVLDPRDSDRPLSTDSDAPEDHNLVEYGDLPGPDGSTDDELVSRANKA